MRHETTRVLSQAKNHTPTRPTDHPNRQNEVIEDVSGENWDEAALSALESVAHTPRAKESSRLERETALPKPDLSHADLHGSDLRTADLSGTVLAKANLSEARLDHAKLESADLRGADLRSTNLSEAQLKNAKLYGAFFNQKTSLPFDKTEAIRRGMIYFEVEPD